MTDFYKVAVFAEIPEGGCKVIYFMLKEIVLFRQAGEVFAVNNLCPHRQAPLCTGEVRDGVVICPRHGACFELTTGKGLPGPHRTDLGNYQVKIEDGDVKIAI